MGAFAEPFIKPFSKTAQRQRIAENENVHAAGLLRDRLRLDGSRVHGMAQGLRDVAGLPDPVGEVVRGSTLANGLQLRQVRVPFGVVGIMICYDSWWPESVRLLALKGAELILYRIAA